MTLPEDNDSQVEFFLNLLNSEYGYDFRGYAKASMKRRIDSTLLNFSCDSIKCLIQKMQDYPDIRKLIVSQLTVNVTDMFRDPEVYLAFRREVIPVLRTYPSIRIWHAGCATGEEVYSMAILLKEEGLYERSFLFGTDISLPAIEKAKAGIYSADQIQVYTANYQKAGGRESFSDYYTSKYGSAIFNASLKKNILFTQHSLVADEIFSEMHLILCRNVMIYFSRELQDRALGLFHRGLVRRGYLCLGTKETLDFSQYATSFETVCKNERIYRKI